MSFKKRMIFIILLLLMLNGVSQIIPPSTKNDIPPSPNINLNKYYKIVPEAKKLSKCYLIDTKCITLNEIDQKIKQIIIQYNIIESINIDDISLKEYVLQLYDINTCIPENLFKYAVLNKLKVSHNKILYALMFSNKCKS